MKYSYTEPYSPKDQRQSCRDAGRFVWWSSWQRWQSARRCCDLRHPYGIQSRHCKETEEWQPLTAFYKLNSLAPVRYSCNLNPLHAKFFRGNKNINLHFMSFLHIDMTQVLEILPQVRQELTILHNQYHGYWCPGDARSQGIINHDIDYVELS